MVDTFSGVKMLPGIMMEELPSRMPVSGIVIPKPVLPMLDELGHPPFLIPCLDELIAGPDARPGPSILEVLVLLVTMYQPNPNGTLHMPHSEVTEILLSVH